MGGGKQHWYLYDSHSYTKAVVSSANVLHRGAMYMYILTVSFNKLFLNIP